MAIAFVLCHVGRINNFVGFEPLTSMSQTCSSAPLCRNPCAPTVDFKGNSYLDLLSKDLGFFLLSLTTEDDVAETGRFSPEVRWPSQWMLRTCVKHTQRMFAQLLHHQP